MNNLNEAVAVLEDCITAGDNREYSLALVSDDYKVVPADLMDAFKKKYGVDYLSYKSK